MSKEYILITGATSGIGYEFAKQFAQNKKNLIIASRNLQKMTEIKMDLEKSYNIEVNTCQIDLSLPGSAEKLYNFCHSNNYSVNILVNNSGIGLGPVIHTERTLQDIRQLLNLNLIALTELCRLFGKDMQLQKAGYILNIASTAAFQPMPYSAIYGASKAYVLMLSEALAIELKPFDVGVTAVCPGLTDTNFFKYGKPQVPAWLYKMVSPELVVKKSIRAMYQKKNYIIPYFQHWLFAQINRFFPRSFIAGLMNIIEKKRKFNC